jgi:hypothetical protein
MFMLICIAASVRMVADPYRPTSMKSDSHSVSYLFAPLKPQLESQLAPRPQLLPAWWERSARFERRLGSQVRTG